MWVYLYLPPWRVHLTGALDVNLNLNVNCVVNCRARAWTTDDVLTTEEWLTHDDVSTRVNFSIVNYGTAMLSTASSASCTGPFSDSESNNIINVVHSPDSTLVGVVVFLCCEVRRMLGRDRRLCWKHHMPLLSLGQPWKMDILRKRTDLSEKTLAIIFSVNDGKSQKYSHVSQVVIVINVSFLYEVIVIEVPKTSSDWLTTNA